MDSLCTTKWITTQARFLAIHWYGWLAAISRTFAYSNVGSSKNTHRNSWIVASLSSRKSLIWAGLLALRLEDGCPQRRGFNLDTRVFGEDHVATALDEVVVDGQGGGIVANAGREVAIAGCDADDASNKTKPVGGDASLECEVAVLVKRTPSEHCEQQRDYHTGFVARRDRAFGIEWEILSFLGGGPGEGSFDWAVVALRELDLLEGEAELPVSGEGFRGSGDGNLADQCRALRDDQLLVVIVDGFDDLGFNRVAGPGGRGAEARVRVALTDQISDLPGVAAAGAGGSDATIGVVGSSTGAVSSNDQAVCASILWGW
jgi:hypothetical protein